MALRITAVHLEGGSEHEHIQLLRYADQLNNETGTKTRAQVVDYIERGGKVYVDEPGAKRVDVLVRNLGGGRPKYVQTYADGVWKNNLLALPPF